MNTAGKQKLKRMDDTNYPEGQGQVDPITGETLPENTVVALHEGRKRMHLVGIDGGKSIKAINKRLDEQKELEKFWEDYRDFDR